MTKGWKNFEVQAGKSIVGCHEQTIKGDTTIDQSQEKKPIKRKQKKILGKVNEIKNCLLMEINKMC